MPDTITELKQRRKGHVDRMREILDAADVDNRDLTAEETQEYDRLEADVDELGVRAQREERHQALERQLAERENGDFNPRQTQRGDGAPEREDEEYNEIFARYIRRGAGELSREERQVLQRGFVEHRDMVKGTGSAGGFAVPTGFERQLQEHLVQAGAVRQTRAFEFNTASGESIQVPKTTAHGAAVLTAEGTGVTFADETLGQVTFDSFTYARGVKMSIQLAEDEAVGLEAYLARELGRSIGALQNQHFVTGDGTAKPQGIVTAATVGKTGLAGQTTTIIYDDVVDLIYSITPPYRRDAEFLASDGILKAIRKLKDGNQHPLWEPSLQRGEPDNILGYPTFNDPDVAAPAASAKSLVFGDLSTYWIRNVRGISLRRLDERFADNLQVGFIAWMRADGDLVDTTGSIKFYAHPAA